MDEALRDLERRSLAGDPESEAKIAHQLARRHEHVARYVSGEHEQVWAELVALGPAVREPRWFDTARAVARETMRRVRRNVETLHQRLTALGYRFADPARAHVAPDESVVARLDALETLLGDPLPLSLRAFYEVVGSMNFAQAPDQIVDDDEDADDLPRLGHDDPLWVEPIDVLEAAVQDDRPDGVPRAFTGDYEDDPTGRHERDRVLFALAPDPLHKVGGTCGLNLEAWLPDRRADFRLIGLEAGDEDEPLAGGEWFVANLRATFLGGGFRGRLDPTGPRGEGRAPPRPLARDLTRGLLPL